MVNLPALIAAELDALFGSSQGARAAELLRGMADSFPANSSYRCYIENCASDIEGDLDLHREIEANERSVAWARRCISDGTATDYQHDLVRTA